MLLEEHLREEQARELRRQVGNAGWQVEQRSLALQPVYQSWAFVALTAGGPELAYYTL
jgi:hypothetical protein